MYQQTPTPYGQHGQDHPPSVPSGARHSTPPIPQRPTSQYMPANHLAPRAPHRPPSWNGQAAGVASSSFNAPLQTPACAAGDLQLDFGSMSFGEQQSQPSGVAPPTPVNPWQGDQGVRYMSGQQQNPSAPHHPPQHAAHLPPAQPPSYHHHYTSPPVVPPPHRGSSYSAIQPTRTGIPIAPNSLSTRPPPHRYRHGSMPPSSSSSSQRLSVHSSAASSASGSSTSSAPPVVAPLPTTDSLRASRQNLDRWPDGEKLSWAEDVLRAMERHLYPGGSPTEFPASNGADTTPQIDLPSELNELTGVAVPIIISTTSHPSTALAATALYLRAKLLSNGACPDFLPKDQRQAFRDYEAAAKSGESRAWFRLGRDYEGVSDLGRARECFEKGKSRGDCECTYRMGMAHLLGQLHLSPDPSVALPLLQTASGLSTVDTPQPAYVYGMLLASELSTPTPIPPNLVIPASPNPSDALLSQWAIAREAIEHAAYLGLAPAQAKCGYFFEHAALGSVYDPLMSVQWYSLASQAGDSDADMSLSKWFLCGAEGHFGKNEELARTFAEKAARKGHPNGCFAMGYYYELGIGGRQDNEQAKKWYQRASKLDNADAKARLAALNSSNPHTLSLSEHQSKLDETLVRRHTQAKIRSDRSSVRRPARAGALANNGGRHGRADAARIDAAARAAAHAPPAPGGVAVGQLFSPNPSGAAHNGQMQTQHYPSATLAPSQAYNLPNGTGNGQGRPPRPQITIPSNNNGPHGRRPSHGGASPVNGNGSAHSSAHGHGSAAEGGRTKRGYTLTDGPPMSGPGATGGVRPSGSMASLQSSASAGGIGGMGQIQAQKAKGPQTFAEMGFSSKPVEDESCVIM